MKRFWIGLFLLISVLIGVRTPPPVAAEAPVYQTYLPFIHTPTDTLQQFEGLVIINEGSQTDLYTVAADGSRQTRLTTLGNVFSYPLPQWSPDGEWILFMAGEVMKYDLYLVRHDGSELHLLNSVTGNKFYARWSPDGQHILFGMRTPTGKTQLYLTTADNSTAYPIGQPHTIDQPEWSPDGRSLAVTTYDNNAPHVILLDATTGTEQPFTDPIARLYFQGWIEGGARLVVSHEIDGGLQGDLYLWTRDGRTATQFTTLWGREEVVSIDPDGARVLYFTTKSTGLEQISLYLQGVNESTALQVADSLCYGYHCGVADISWSPDNNAFAYTRWLVLDEMESESVVELVHLEDLAKVENEVTDADLPLWLDSGHLAVRHYSGTWDAPLWHASLLNLTTGSATTLGPSDGKATLVAWRPR